MRCVPEPILIQHEQIIIRSILTVVQCLLYHEKCKVWNGGMAVTSSVDALVTLKGSEAKQAMRQSVSLAFICTGIEVQILATNAPCAPRMVSTSLMRKFRIFLKQKTIRVLTGCDPLEPLYRYLVFVSCPKHIDFVATETMHVSLVSRLL